MAWTETVKIMEYGRIYCKEKLEMCQGQDCEDLEYHAKEFVFIPSASHTCSNSSQDLSYTRIASGRSNSRRLIYPLMHFQNIDSWLLIRTFRLKTNKPLKSPVLS